MRARSALVSSLLVGVVVLGLVVSSAPTQAASEAFHFRYRGKSADAGFTTCPSMPAPGVLCIDTFISAGEQMSWSSDDRSASTSLFLYQHTYKYDRRGNYVFVSERYGTADTSLSIDAKLMNATASATVPLTVCTIDRFGILTCTDGAGSAVVNATWRGVGDLVRWRGTYQTKSKGFMVNSSYSGSYREAIAVAQVDGASPGGLTYATLVESKSRDVSIARGTGG